MICLMVINGMLYYKLRRIETLADGIRHDPTFVNKMSTTGGLSLSGSDGISDNHQLPKAFNEAAANQRAKQDFNSLLNKNSMQEDLSSWRDVISNTLNVIQRVKIEIF